MNMQTTKSLKVLQITSGDLWAGAEVQLYTLATELNKMSNVEVSVLLLNSGTLEKKLIESGIRVFIIDEAKYSSIDILKRLKQIINQVSPDIVHTHRLKVNIFGSMAAFICGRIPSVRTAHGSQEHPPSWKQISKRIIFYVEWLCGRFIQKNIIAVSENLSTILSKSFPSNKIHIIENGIDSSSLIESNKNIERNSKAINEPLEVGVAGRLVSIKRIDIFIEIAEFFKKHYPEMRVRFHVYGDGPLIKELKQLSVNLKTDDIVRFEGHCEDMPSKLKTLDALIMTSDHEGLPMVLLEAMALETPVVAHAVGGIPNLLDHGRCGMLVEDHSASGYTKALHKLLGDISLNHEITKNALERVMNVYSSKNNAKAHLSLYRKYTKDV